MNRRYRSRENEPLTQSLKSFPISVAGHTTQEHLSNNGSLDNSTCFETNVKVGFEHISRVGVKRENPTHPVNSPNII